jgi:hypothetical protein
VLALDPSKKNNYLDTALGWEKEWVDSVKTNFAVKYLLISKNPLH